MSTKKVEEILQGAYENIQDDRAIATKLLSEVMKYLAKDSSHHQQTGMVAAKYLETLQRSNEQLVKIAALHQKKVASGGLSDIDKEQLYDMINKGD
jgi:F0F1-type ATP synthase membrane subunit b/b'